MQVKVGVANSQETNTLHSGPPLLLVGDWDFHIAAEAKQLVLLEVAVCGGGGGGKEPLVSACVCEGGKEPLVSARVCVCEGV